jgi:hypothetical protein
MGEDRKIEIEQILALGHEQVAMVRPEPIINNYEHSNDNGAGGCCCVVF